MCSVKGWVAVNAQVLRAHPLHLPARWMLRALVVAATVGLVACATPQPLPAPPPVVVPASTWRAVDGDMLSASRDATEEAKDYARGLMQRWRGLVYQRTEAEFIPWFSSYWTRQWLSMKVTWYQLNADGEKDRVVNRLALYLQEQYQDRVLEPVAREISPDWIMAQTTQLYVRLLRDRILGIPLRYGVPADQFDQRLLEIPAIALPSSHGASLHQLVHAEPIDAQPAYLALVERINASHGNSGDWSANAGISAVARRTSETLTTELTTRSVAGAVSALVGRVAGAVISLGATGFTTMLGESRRPGMEAQLRKTLHGAFDEDWLDLMHNPDTGVLAGVHHLSGQIEGTLAARLARPLEPEFAPAPELAPRTLAVPMESAPPGDEDEAAYRLW